MTKNKLVAPVLKWVGGKRQLLPELAPMMPKLIKSYCEPFVGGGAVLFDLQPKKAIINDINQDLILVYTMIRDNVDGLIQELEQYPNEETFYYNLRNLDRDQEQYSALSDIKRAARVLYLNKTCYNGLYRVNNAGEFNSPFGKYKNPNIVNAPVLRAVSTYFNSAEIEFSSEDFTVVLQNVRKGTFVYLDPPYDPVSETSSFTGYARGGFDRKQQVQLRECCDSLNERGIKFMLSNSATDFIMTQYAAYHIKTVQAKRLVNAIATKRGDVDEVIITNYE